MIPGMAFGTAVLMALAAASTPVGVAAQPTPGWFRGGAAPLGVADTRGVERLGGVAWTFETGGAVRGSPTVAGGTVYIGSSDGTLYALDAATGALGWRYDAGAAVGGAPLVTDDRVVVATRGNTVHAVDRRTGRRVWTRALGPDLPLTWGHEGWDYVLPSAVPAGGSILIGSGDGGLYALDPSDGSVRWRFGTQGRIRGTPTVVDGVAYVGSGDGIVYGVDVADGTERWRFTTAGVEYDASRFGFDRTQIQASPAVVDGALYIGSRDASLYAIDLATGQARWTVEDGSAWVVNSPAVRDGVVYSGRSSGGRVRALRAATGEELWMHPTGGIVFSSPVLVGDMLYIGSGDERVHALDARDGTPRWSFTTGGRVLGTPAVWEGRLYVGSDDGTVYALQAAEGPAPRRAVYWDDAFMERSLLGASEDHRRLAAHFERFGYEMLDSAGVEDFLRQGAEGGSEAAPGVVVFAMDGVPASVVDAADPSSSLLRRYLEAGGKVVWPGTPPLILSRDAEGRITGIDRDAAGAVLGLDHTGWDTDAYPVAVTDTGRRWGLREAWVGAPRLAVPEASEVLAVTETGAAAAYVRSFGGAEGTGWVVVPSTLSPSRLEDMRRVAEYGIFRRPPPNP